MAVARVAAVERMAADETAGPMAVAHCAVAGRTAVAIRSGVPLHRCVAVGEGRCHLWLRVPMRGPFVRVAGHPTCLRTCRLHTSWCVLATAAAGQGTRARMVDRFVVCWLCRLILDISIWLVQCRPLSCANVLFFTAALYSITAALHSIQIWLLWGLVCHTLAPFSPKQSIAVVKLTANVLPVGPIKLQTSCDSSRRLILICWNQHYTQTYSLETMTSLCNDSTDVGPCSKSFTHHWCIFSCILIGNVCLCHAHAGICKCHT